MTKSQLKSLIREVLAEGRYDYVPDGESPYRPGENLMEYMMAFKVEDWNRVKKLFDSLLKKKLIDGAHIPTLEQVKQYPKRYNSRVNKPGWFDVTFTTYRDDPTMVGETEIDSWCKKNNLTRH